MLLDTQVLLWLRLGSRNLGRRARGHIDRAWDSDELAVSAISFWELAMLQTKGRIRFPENVGLWRREQLEQGLVEIPIDGAIGVRAALLEGMHGDPADRLIIATAMEGHRLLTADQRILGWAGALDRLDATD